MKTIHLEKSTDKVAIISMNNSNALSNTVTLGFLQEFEQIIALITEDPDIQACILKSQKEDHFIQGMDLKTILETNSEKEVEFLYTSCQNLLEKLEASKKPIVSAIHGVVSGFGLGIVLACHYRISTDDPKTLFSSPEVMLGLVPMAGGVQRSINRIGIINSLSLLMTGKGIRTRKAKKIGLVDEVVPKDKLFRTAIEMARKLSHQKHSLPQPKPNLSDVLMLKSLQLPYVGNFIFAEFRKQIQRKTRGLYQAPLAILDCIRSVVQQGDSLSYSQERTWFKRLALSQETRNLLWLSNSMQELSQIPKDSSNPEARRLLVLGAGLMGEGVTSISLPLSPVTVRDINPDSLIKLEQNIQKSLEKRVASGSLSAKDRKEQHARLHTVSDLSKLSKQELKEIDLVIEAVFESLELKQKVLRETEEVVSEKAVFASNTSALPIQAIAANARHPERVLGMHYFSPVPKMPLLEIIVTPQTADWALATAAAYGKAQGKSVIVVQDSPGFYTTRILAPFLNEAMLLLEEGVQIEKIDPLLCQFGYPLGPIALLDEVGIDIGAHVSENLGEELKQKLKQNFPGRKVETSDLLVRLHRAGFAGKKNARGFYQYPKPGKKRKGPKKVNPEVYRVLKVGQRSKVEASDSVILDRIVLTMVNEAARCLEEKVIRSPRDADIGAVLGLGFAPFRGGPFHYIDSVGVSEVVSKMTELSQKYGDRFQPAEILKKYARDQLLFYPQVDQKREQR